MVLWYHKKDNSVPDILYVMVAAGWLISVTSQGCGWGERIAESRTETRKKELFKSDGKY